MLALTGGTWGYSRYGYAGLSPLAVVLLIALVLWFTGHLRIS